MTMTMNVNGNVEDNHNHDHTITITIITLLKGVKQPPKRPFHTIKITPSLQHLAEVHLFVGVNYTHTQLLILNSFTLFHLTTGLVYSIFCNTPPP